MSSSRLFRRNRALGFVSNHVPASVRYISGRRENVIVTCIGRSFHTYGANRFRLIAVSGLHPEDITCLAADSMHVYAASAKNIYAWRSGNTIKHIYKGHSKNVRLLLPFGQHLISVDDDNVLKVWDISTEDVYLDIPFNSEDFLITAVMHPYTYLNKILLGSSTGQLQLWNIREAKLVYTFGKLSDKVTVLEQAPATDVAAIGLGNGSIILLNLKFDEKIMEFKQDWGPVTGISFRTDGHSVMATSSTNGQIAFWNLDERKVITQLVAHNDSVTTTQCLPSEPLLLTTSPDNSMKLWIFDLSDGGARLLRQREGHAEPPTCIRYHGAKGEQILSAGEDSSLRIFSTVSETLNKNLGRASYNRKASKKKNRFQTDSYLMPPIMHFTTETTREKEWDNIAAIHSGLTMVTTWSFDKCKMGDLKLLPERFQNKNKTDFKAEASCICITHCGNFVLIGYSSGHVDRFNIQSGLHRAAYGNPAHPVAVRGVSCDNIDQIVVTGGANGVIKFWHFKDTVAKPIRQIKLDHEIAFFRTHRDSSMLCVALDNFTVNIIDCDTRQLVRKFAGHTASITDACFSPDSRWLITAAMDLSIKVWDIPSSYLIDQFKVHNACTSLTMSPTGNFLATSHVNFLGIYLWANKTLFSHVSLRSIPDSVQPTFIDLPSTQYEEQTLEDNVTAMQLDENDLGEEISLVYKSPEQLHEDLVTMSPFAASKWQNLLQLSAIKKRNQNLTTVKVPKQAPFFLPTVAGLEFKFDMSEKSGTEDQKRILVPESFDNFTTFGRLLVAEESDSNYEAPIAHLLTLGPSMVDFEITSLSPFGSGSVAIMVKFMKMIGVMLASNTNFEMAQSYLGVFVKTHGRIIAETAALHEQIAALELAQTESWKSLEERLLFGIGVVSALRNFVE